jgi:hypothetical protein
MIQPQHASSPMYAPVPFFPLRRLGTSRPRSSWSGVALLLPFHLLPILAFTGCETRQERDEQSQDRSIMKLEAVGDALRQYYVCSGRLPPLGTSKAEGGPKLSWRVFLVPLLGGEEKLYSRLRTNEPWDSDHNRDLAKAMPPIYSYDPGNATRDPAESGGKTCYFAVVGPGTLFEKSEREGRLSDNDMKSRRALVIEVDEDRATAWTKPDDPILSPGKPIHGVRGRRFGKCLVLLANGDIIAVPGTDSGGLPDLSQASLAGQSFVSPEQIQRNMDQLEQMQKDLKRDLEKRGISPISERRSGQKLDVSPFFPAHHLAAAVCQNKTDNL